MTATAFERGLPAVRGVGRALAPPVPQCLALCCDDIRTGKRRSAVEVGWNR